MSTGYGIQAWGIAVSGGGGGSGEIIKPVVTIITPLENLAFNDPIVFNVTDNEGLANVQVTIKYAALGLAESAYDGENFAPNFLAPRRLSTKTAISNGFRFTLYRLNGWPSTPTLIVRAVDTSGNVADV
jgi:hypothetical protein